MFFQDWNAERNMNRNRMLKAGLAVTIALVPLAVACTQSPADAQSGSKVRSMSQSERAQGAQAHPQLMRSEEHTSELQSLMRISYAVFCLKKKKKHNNTKY